MLVLCSLLLVSVLPLPGVHAQDDDPRFFTTSSGLGFPWPDNLIIVEQDDGSVHIANSDTAPFTHDPAAGGFFGFIMDSDMLRRQLNVTASDLSTAHETFSAAFPGLEEFVFTALYLNNLTAFRYSATNEDQVIFILLFMVEDRPVMIYATTLRQYAPHWERELLRLASTMSYDPVALTWAGFVAEGSLSGGEGPLRWRFQFRAESGAEQLGTLNYPVVAPDDSIFLSDRHHIVPLGSDGKLGQPLQMSRVSVVTMLAAGKDRFWMVGGASTLYILDRDGAVITSRSLHEDLDVNPMLRLSLTQPAVGLDGNLYLFISVWESGTGSRGYMLVMDREGELLRQWETTLPATEAMPARFALPSLLALMPDGHLLLYDPATGANRIINPMDGGLIEDNPFSVTQAFAENNIRPQSIAVTSTGWLVIAAEDVPITVWDRQENGIAAVGQPSDESNEERFAYEARDPRIAIFANDDLLIVDRHDGYTQVLRVQLTDLLE
jgi:hypothetical protein